MVEGQKGEAERAILTCSQCGDEIDCCEFCDDPDCPVLLCYGCVHLALGEMVQQPHAHGG
jgi:hypothetical protein